MKKDMQWYKRCPSDWQKGTRRHAMSFELRGFYSECLDVMWELQAQLPKDSKQLAMLLGTNARMVRALMPKLLLLGKMIETGTGYYNPRMMVDILGSEEALSSSEYAAVPASAGNQVDTEPTSNQPRLDVESRSKIEKKPTITTREVEEEKEIDSPLPPKGGSVPILEAFELWNSKALELGLPQAATLSPARRRSIGARLREAGGLDGWRKMLAELGRSAFLLGRKDGCDFRADLDFVLKPSRFPKILDGGYADKDAPAAGSGPWWQDPAKLATMTPDRWRTGIEKHANGKWPIMELGPWPGDPKCLVPRELVDELHLTEKYDPRTGLAKGAWAAEQRKLHEVRA